MKLAALAGSITGLLAWPASASAHGLVGRAGLPIPSWLFGWGAALVLVASFIALGTLWPEPRLQVVRSRELFRMPAAVPIACGAIGLLVFVAVVYSGFAGTSVPTANLAPTFIYVHFWVGVVVLSAIFGDVFRVLSPWRALAIAGAWVLRRLGRRTLRPRYRYPDLLGRWPAVIGILGFGWLELAYANKDVPSTLAALSLAYMSVQLVGMALFGIETWCERGDAFGSLFSLYARMSPLERRDGRIFLRRPLAGAPSLPLYAGTVALLAVAIGVTTFDGLSNGPVWRSVAPDLQDLFKAIGAGSVLRIDLANTVGLLACVLLVGGFYQVGVRGMSTVDLRHNRAELSRRFAHTLIPIAFAYALAHYFSLLAYQGQAIGYLASDPLGNGSNLFGTASAAVDYSLISAAGVWYVQVAALVFGHVSGLVLAHDRALAVYQRIREASRSQYWLLVVMVGFTSLGLWLLSAVNA